MIITKKNQVEHKIIKLDRFRRSSTKLVPQTVQNDPIIVPYQPQLHQTNQLQDKPIQYYMNNNFIYNNVSPVQFPQPFVETNQPTELPLNKSKSISFIAYSSQCQNDLQNENEANDNVLLLTPACASSNYVYNKTPSKIGESALNKSKPSLPCAQTMQQESKWNLVIMPCQNENMEIVREVNEGGCNCNSNKENSTMFQTEHSQLIIENTPSRTNYNTGQMLLKEIYENGNDNDEQIKGEEHKEEDDVALFKGDANIHYGKSDNNVTNGNTTTNKDNSKTPNSNSNFNIPMRNILPFNKSITPLFSVTNLTSSLEAHNTSSSHTKITTVLNNPLHSSQKHHATPSLQIHNLKRFHTERSNTNCISNNFLLDTISFNHHSPKAINPQSLNSSSKQIRAIILKESITEVNKHKPQTEGNNTNTRANTCSGVVNNEINIQNCIEPSSSNRIVHDECLSSPHTTKNSRSKLSKVNVNVNRTQMRNVAGVKGKSFLTPKGIEHEKKNILFPSFLKNDKIAIMKYKHLLKNTSSITTPPSTPCATNNNKVVINTQPTNIDNKNTKNNNNLSNRDKKQTTTTTIRASSRSKGKHILDNKAKYQNVINSFYSSTDIPQLSYKHSFIETKRTGLNLVTKLALPANNFDNDKDRNSNYIHI